MSRSHMQSLARLARACTLTLIIYGTPGCVTRTVVVTSDPPKARVAINGVEHGTTPYTTRLQWDEGEHHRVDVSAENYETETRDLTRKAARSARDPWELEIQLLPLVTSVPLHISTVPPGATVVVDGRPCGTSPLLTAVQFKRESAAKPWSTAVVKADLSNFLSEFVTITKDQAERGQLTINLVETRRELPVRISCNVDTADVVIDGKVVGTTPLERTFVFERSSASDSWPSFQIEVSKPDYFWRPVGAPIPATDHAPFTAALSIDQAATGLLRVDLEPFKFRWTKLASWDFGPDGPYIEHELVLSQVGEIDTEPMVKAASRITDAQPGHLVMTRLWSPSDSDDVVFSIPFDCDNGGLCANVWRQIGQGTTRFTDSPTVDLEATVSKDGSFVYFSSNRLNRRECTLWRIQTTGQGGFTKITDSPAARRDTGPSVSPDGTKIAYTSYLQKSDVPSVWTAKADGTLPTQLRVGSQPAWSPDGTKIAYTSQDKEGYDQIWVMGADSSNPTQLTRGRAHRRYATWTPTGDKLVFASNEALNEEGLPNFDIWIMQANGTNRTQLTVNGSYDTRPAISPDGKYVYFVSNRGAKQTFDDNWQIWRIELP